MTLTYAVSDILRAIINKCFHFLLNYPAKYFKFNKKHSDWRNNNLIKSKTSLPSGGFPEDQQRKGGKMFVAALSNKMLFHSP